MIQQNIERILSEYIQARNTRPFNGQDQTFHYFNTIKTELSESPEVQSRPHIQVKFSLGQGNWARVPWIALMDDRETTTTQEGVYCVFLFREDMSGIYITFNQGVTALINKLGQNDARRELHRRAQAIHPLCAPLIESNFFLNNEIDLRAGNALGTNYEHSTIAYKLYERGLVPPDDNIISDLNAILTVYDEYLRKKTTIIPPPPSPPMRPIPLAKPFLLLAGISGTGKTRFVRSQAARSNGWSAEDHRKPDNYELVAVRPDWHEPSDLLGYVSRIDGTKYVSTPFLSFLVKAWKEVFDKGGSLHQISDGTRPFWLCLDEMNLAPVEQYFADYLSILESRKWSAEGYSSLPIIGEHLDLVMTALGGSEADVMWKAFLDNNGIPLPPNLIVAGTVNMDETTHGFSRKVIDRALTIDFPEFFPNRFEEFFEPKTEPKVLGYPTLSQIRSEKELAAVPADPGGKESVKFLTEINGILKTSPFELAYRAMNELLLAVKCFNPENEKQLTAVWDDFLMQKVLPRIEGDAEKLQYNGEDETGILDKLKELLEKRFKSKDNIEEGITSTTSTRPDLMNRSLNGGNPPECRYKSLDKIDWMQNRLRQNQYTSFWA